MDTSSFYVSLYVPKHLSKKNNRPTWKGRIGKSDQLRSMEKYLIASFRQAHKGASIKGDLWVKIIFHTSKYYTKKGERNKKMGDLQNLIALPLDCLQTAGVIEDDTDVVSLDGSRRCHSDHNRLEICIWTVP